MLLRPRAVCLSVKKLSKVMKKHGVLSLTTVVTAFCISATTADGVFHVDQQSNKKPDIVCLQSDQDRPIEILKQSVENIQNISEISSEILSELLLEKQENMKNASVTSFAMAESFIKDPSVSFGSMPETFTRPSGHPAFYWGLGKNRHITLSVIDDDLLLSIVFPDKDTRIVMPSSIANFSELAHTVNEYLG